MEKLQVYSMREVFETNEIKNNINNKSGGSSAIPRLGNIMMLKLPNLKIVSITCCDLLEHIFTFSTLGTLGHLEVLSVESCKAMKEIVKEESGDKTKIPNNDVVVFPRLKSITLINLPNLVGFFLGMNVFRWPVLDDVTILDCPQMTVFTSGQSITSKLKYIQTRLGKHSLECGLNFHVTSTLHQISSRCPTTLERLPWSFHNLIEIHLRFYESDSKIIPSSELLQLKKLEKIQLKFSHAVEEVFELAREWTNSGSNDSKSVVKLPNLKEMEFYENDGLKYIWKSNEWTVLEFPNLTTLSIYDCNRLEHVFTSSMVGSLLQLQHLEISDCKSIEVIVREEAGDANDVVVFPLLKSLKLEKLEKLKGFCLGKDDFSWPLLNSLILNNCPAMEVFTMGHLATPELKVIDTDFRNSFDAREDLNSFIKRNIEQGSYSGEDGEKSSHGSYSGEDGENNSLLRG